MERPISMRSLRTICASCRTTLRTRPISYSARAQADQPAPPPSSSPAQRKAQDPSGIDSLLGAIQYTSKRASSSPFSSKPTTSPFNNLIPSANEYASLVPQEWPEDTNHHMHVHAHKHNTHITITRPNRDPILSLSCGNIGFRKSGRGSYDAAYQLAAYVMARVQDKGWLAAFNEKDRIKGIEIVYRGFGPGREAVTKAILGTEGRNIRPLINKLSDSTRLKFGGTRSKKPRRLG